MHSAASSGWPRGPASFVREYAYDAAGRLTASGPVGGQPGVRTTYSYDDAWRMTRVIQRNPSGGVTFNDLQYTFDKSDNVPHGHGHQRYDLVHL